MADNKIKIGITQGDTNGIGWEVILKIFSDSRMCELCTPVIYGSRNVADQYKKLLKDLEPVNFNIVTSAAEARRGKVNLVECGKSGDTITPGTPSSDAGMAAIEALVKAANELKKGDLEAIVTAPFNKESVQSDKFAHTGHTEFMASQFEGDSMMMMCSELMKVGLVTKHLPLQDVAKSITSEMIVKDINSLRKTLIQDFAIVEPRIAVLSLNPHAGDGGLLGSEEETIITPAIKEAYQGGALAFGPFAADGFFSAGGYKKYDAILAMYHDQGLIPFKTLSPEGVNFTAGLTAVRTSPDHGVAYDIAGKGYASADSMRNAIYMAIDIVESRRIYSQISKNPLPHTELERERGDRGDRRERHDRHDRNNNGERSPREGGFRREQRTPRPEQPTREPQSTEEATKDNK